MTLFKKKLLDKGAATVYRHRFRMIKYEIVFKDCSVIARTRTYDEALAHLVEVDNYRQDLIIKKLKTA